MEHPASDAGQPLSTDRKSNGADPRGGCNFSRAPLPVRNAEARMDAHPCFRAYFIVWAAGSSDPASFLQMPGCTPDRTRPRTSEPPGSRGAVDLKPGRGFSARALSQGQAPCVAGGIFAFLTGSGTGTCILSVFFNDHFCRHRESALAVLSRCTMEIKRRSGFSFAHGHPIGLQ